MNLWNIVKSAPAVTALVLAILLSALPATAADLRPLSIVGSEEAPW